MKTTSLYSQLCDQSVYSQLYGQNFLGNYSEVDAGVIKKALTLHPDIEMVLEPAMYKTPENTVGVPMDNYFSLYVLKSDAGLGAFWKTFDALKFKKNVMAGRMDDLLILNYLN